MRKEVNKSVLIDLETGEETKLQTGGNSDEEDDDNALDETEKKMSLHDYRESCQEAFYEAFRSIRDF